MSELLVYKASAGSGKTFTLAVEYIKLLILNPRAYRQILAVTFTNKATAEMKERILSQLYGIQIGDKDSEAYLNRIKEETGKTEQEIREAAGVALSYMLHDYSRFRVETIDSFFQSVMRNLARELELSPNLNIELNNTEVLSDAVDSMIEKLGPTSPVLAWLLDYINERIADDKRWNVSDEVKSFGRNIFDEGYIEKGEGLRQRLRNPDTIKEYRKQLKALESKGTPEVLERFCSIKQTKKQQLADFIAAKEGVTIDPNSIFDIQIKRLHEYKRQLLNAFSILYLYEGIKDGSIQNFTPTTFLFGAKSAPGYRRAKAIIKFINEVGKLIANDPDVNQLIKVVFVSNYNVSYAEKLVAAADVSEQISTAGTEASGTGNMKLMLNGAITLGTLDGANIEIGDAVGSDNILIFGMKTEEVNALKAQGYHPGAYYEQNPIIHSCIDRMYAGINGCKFAEVADSLKNIDPYMVLADFDSYAAVQKKSSELYQDTEKWTKMSLHNIAGAGIFSADRAVNEYARDIWGVK